MNRPRRLISGRLLGVVLLVLLAAGSYNLRGAGEGATFNGSRAFEDLKRITAFGPRPAGSASLVAARQWMIQQLRREGLAVEEDKFTASTPVGNLPMSNLLIKLPGTRPQIVILAGHYDTKRFPQFSFVGANDGGSSTAWLLEMARVLKRRKNACTIWLVFFDGEEAVGEWSARDGVYGSRHLVSKLSASGELARVRAMILVDMIGDADLRVQRDLNSTEWLSDLVFGTARRLGYERFFSGRTNAFEDDHRPFVDAGVPAVDLIDLDYGPGNSYWHTPADTQDKCSPLSLTVVGRVVLAVLDRLERSPRSR